MRFGATWGLALPLVLSLSALTPVLGERTAQEIVLDANRFLAEGQYTSAARAYGEAIGEYSSDHLYPVAPLSLPTSHLSMYRAVSLTNKELDPNSYLNYYKRATVYLSLGRHNAAIDDFDSILRLNPAFAQVSKAPYSFRLKG